ncbi:hypothetical protein U6A24_02495 [Aquimarina gracilis]|uniref:Uncharacterized protein n=1 Tax=Aquimarina gracilis TaxID=874422 RepID=A0ABU5ZQG2_9FLAO|nr:hypothetical protein [Aquimarina gracilis]MEB3344309.1 hypothetical protein [Aquimarina gracilis]
MSLYHKIKRNLFPVNEGPVKFPPQFRIEGRSRDANNKSGLEMRVADPLWMLGRQWQFGEFNAEDNGSPISAQANFRKQQIDAYSFTGFQNPKSLEGAPLEPKVEAVKINPNDLRSKVRIGQKIASLIKDMIPFDEANDLIAGLQVEFPLQPLGEMDQRSSKFFDLMSVKVIDGGQLLSAIENETLPSDYAAQLSEVIDRLKNWYKELHVEPDEHSSWNPKHLAHEFKVHGPDNTSIKAPDYQNGHLDWYSFDSAGVDIDPDEQTQNTENFMPTRVSFAASPDRRLFSFEDNILQLDEMDMDESDFVKLLISDFTLTSDNDWFTIPLQMKLGEMCWVNHIDVKDVFGITTRIKNNEQTVRLNGNGLKVWDAFKIRKYDALNGRLPGEPLFNKKEHFLYLPQVTTFKQESRPLEELLFLRDEYANMVWAVEKTVSNGMGKPTNGYDLHLELNGPFVGSGIEEQNNSSIPRFRLGSPVPSNWIPYLPFHIEDNVKHIELRRAVMVRNDIDTELADINPISSLAQNDITTIREEAIPREGVRVQLTKQRARAANGKTFVWLGRKISVGKGEGSSGLQFDKIENR